MEKFCSIPIQFFEKLETSSCDVYLRLGDEKYVKIVNKGDPITKETLDSFHNKNIKSFYVTDEEFKRWSNELLPLSGSKSDENLPDNKNLNLFLNSVGISHLTCVEVERTYKQILTNFIHSKNIHSLLRGMINNRKRFLYDHSYLVGVISIEIANRCDWGVSGTKEKLVMAALLHDLKLDEDLATMADRNDLNENVSIPIRSAFIKHGELMAKELSDEKDIPDDVIKIVKGHHSISNPHPTILTAIFVVAHEFVTRLYNYQLNPEMVKQSIKDTQDFFRGTVFEKYGLELEKAVNKEGSSHQN